MEDTLNFFLQMEDDQNKFVDNLNFYIQMADDLNIIVNWRQPLKLKNKHATKTTTKTDIRQATQQPN